MEKEKILTVGIDLGTSTTQMILSELTVENFASSFAVPRISISDKKVIFKSEIIFTPLIDQQAIDVERLKHFITEQYQKAGITKEEIQLGAVIITGETARKSNASNVLSALSGYAGDFVVATAGPDLESIIAAKGAGTHLLSEKEVYPIANLDIGGGTTNLAVFENGEVVDTGCFDVGGRLIKYDPETLKIYYISPKIQTIIEKEQLNLKIGGQLKESDLKPIIQILTEVLENSVGLLPLNPYFDLLVTHHPLQQQRDLPALTFSGGVADFIRSSMGESPYQYGDIGIYLGRSLYYSRLFKEKKIFQTSETIRATVVGAGSHTAEVSGSTVTFREKVLPIKNLPIVKMAKDDETQSIKRFAELIQEKINWQRTENETPLVALAFNGIKNPKFTDIQDYAQAVIRGMAEQIEKKMPLIILVYEDMAKALGQSLIAMLPENYPIVCLDSVKVENGDYIDIGQSVAEGTVLPVIVKTLVFH